MRGARLMAAPLRHHDLAIRPQQFRSPRAVRNISALQRRLHAGFGVDPWDATGIIDAGDVPFPRANDNEHCIEQITSFFRQVEAVAVMFEMIAMIAENLS